MLESELADLLDQHGVNDISTKTDSKGVRVHGVFPGTKTQLRNRLGSEVDLTMDETTEGVLVTCRPLE